MTVRVKSYARQFKSKMRSENKKRLRQCAKITKDRAKSLLSVSGVGRITKGNLVRAKTARGKNAVIGAFRSKPGQPPLRQTGYLLKSVTQALIGYTKGRVQTSAFYGRILDSPNYKPGRRPWLKKALEDMLPEIKRILTRKMDLE
jgi:hypothetical protein